MTAVGRLLPAMSSLPLRCYKSIPPIFIGKGKPTVLQTLLMNMGVINDLRAR
ncbi:hypothetical protein [Teredinibacter waterburyi]|uniref:hypothetical protein n=1 Tax=Teredinibacter waterburyi TaxID=1500538 RepID=UPI00165F1DE1|nr:hypothetical protein [Teredinibacter waterburyi]